MVEPLGGFLLVHISTPLPICEVRDSKGLYAKARLGAIPSFTGISDPYEAPDDAELVVDCPHITAGNAAETIADYVRTLGYFDLIRETPRKPIRLSSLERWTGVSIDSQIRRSVFANPSPEGRGWPKGPGEG